MTELLQPAKLDTRFEYQVEKNGDIYVAEAKNCNLNQGMAILGDLLLDKLGERDSRVWTPRITNPFATETRTIETRHSELYVPHIMIAHSAWKGKSQQSIDEFIGNMEKGILQEYQARMSKDDLVQFFEQVHRHYMDYF